MELLREIDELLSRPRQLTAEQRADFQEVYKALGLDECRTVESPETISGSSTPPVEITDIYVSNSELRAICREVAYEIKGEEIKRKTKMEQARKEARAIQKKRDQAAARSKAYRARKKSSSGA